jgi:hypothetical protein
MNEVRLIDANALRDSISYNCSGIKMCMVSDILEFIDNAPAINPTRIPDVCRCEECELWNDWDKVGRESLGTLRCSCGHWSTGDGHTTYTAPNDFCSYGLKKGKE